MDLSKYKENVWFGPFICWCLLYKQEYSIKFSSQDIDPYVLNNMLL